MHEKHDAGFAALPPSRTGPVLVGFLALAGYFLRTEHEAHIGAAIASGWLGRTYPSIDLFSHDAGHLLSTALGFVATVRRVAESERTAGAAR